MGQIFCKRLTADILMIWTQRVSKALISAVQSLWSNLTFESGVNSIALFQDNLLGVRENAKHVGKFINCRLVSCASWCRIGLKLDNRRYKTTPAFLLLQVFGKRFKIHFQTSLSTLRLNNQQCNRTTTAVVNTYSRCLVLESNRKYIILYLGLLGITRFVVSNSDDDFDWRWWTKTFVYNWSRAAVLKSDFYTDGDISESNSVHPSHPVCAENKAHKVVSSADQ